MKAWVGRFFSWSGWVLALILILGITVFTFLPAWVRSEAIKKAQAMGIPVTGLTVDAIGLGSASFSRVVIADGQFTVPFLRVEYSLSGLRKGEIKRVQLSGIHAGIVIRGQEISLRGFPKLPTLSAKSETPLSIPAITLSGAQIDLDMDGRKTTLCFDGSLSGGQASEPLQIDGHLLYEGNPIHIRAMIAPGSGDGQVELHCPRFALATLQSFPGNMPVECLGGDLDAHAVVTLSGWKPGQITFSGQAEGVTLTGPDLSVSEPFTVTLYGQDAGWTVLFSPINLDKPFTGRLEELTLHGQDFPGLNEATISARLILGDTGVSSLTNGAMSSRPLTLALKGKMQRVGEAYPWQVEADYDGAVTARVQELNISGQMAAGLRLAGLGMNGKGTLTARLSTARISAAPWTFQTPALTARAEIGFGPSLTYAGTITTTLGRYEDTTASIAVTDISGTLPFASTGVVGELPITASRFQHPRFTLSDLSIMTAVSAGMAVYHGSGKLAIKPLLMTFSGDFGFALPGKPLNLTLQIPRTTIPLGTDLAPLRPALTGIKIGGDIHGTGLISSSAQSEMRGSAELSIDGLDLTMESKKLEISGLSGTIHFDRLFDFTTQPAQEIRFAAGKFGPAKFQDGLIFLRLEGGDSTLIERFEFAFCGGHMLTSAFRVATAQPEMGVDVFCDKLQLADLLNLISGKGNASGEGTISGIVPLVIDASGLRFKDANLATSPGHIGTLKVVDAEQMTGGMLLAEEAIRDFAYDWAKVNIGSAGDRLNMTVQLSGKPRLKLPLRYDPASQGFVRDPSGERLVELKGLLLDLKFMDIDLNRLIKEQGKWNR
jgi:hypothetical protein